jgi:alkylated DNA repair dioxygenase AlkB
MKIIKICDGIVLLKKFLSIEEQNALIRDILNPMTEKRLFWDENGELNFFGRRGRHYCNIDDYENKIVIQNLCQSVMKEVLFIDSTIPGFEVTHLLTLYYPTTKGINWHSDKGKNDGDHDSPVISLSLGNSCVFQYTLIGTKEVQLITLESGDILVFGGLQRFMFHAVKTVLPNSFSSEIKLPTEVRINMTFRQAKTIVGNEDDYSTVNYMTAIDNKRS